MASRDIDHGDRFAARADAAAVVAGLILSLALAGCQAGASVTEAPASKLSAASFCDVAKPIYWSKNDSEQTVAQVKELNAAGKKACGWN